jgi:hypothetical protein
MKKKILSILILIIMALGGIYLYNSTRQNSPMTDIKLTSIQQKELKGCRDNFMGEMAIIHKELQALNELFNKSLVENIENPDVYKSIKKQMESKYQEMLTLRIKNMKRLKNLLSKEQFEKYSYNCDRCRIEVIHEK